MARIFTKIKDALLRRKPVAHGYKHGTANYLGVFNLDNLPPFTLFTADTMLKDPQVKFGLTIRNGGLLQAEVEVKGDSEQEVAFVKRQWDRLWNMHAGLLLRAKRWGYAPFEVTFRQETGRFKGWVGVDDLHFFHPRDARLLIREGQHAGIRVSRLRDVGQEQILMPSALWVTHQADTGNRYGMSINYDAYSPWWEKWMERGAKDVLRLRMIRDAYSGDVFKVPMELVERPDGTQVPYMDLIREAIEDRLAGSPMFLPNMLDDNGNSLIEYTPPSDNGRPEGILEWAERLDWDIWKGQGVVREVVEAATSGSGYSGRSIPMTTFLTALGEELKEVVRCVDRDVLRHLVHINMGREPSYEIHPKSLVETFADDMSNSGMGGSMGGTQGQAPQWGQQQLQGPPRQPTQFSEDATGHQYSCLMGRFHPDVAAKIWNISQRIADDDLAEDGRENWPHLTLLYGIHANEPDQVKHLLRDQGPIALRFGGYGVFENPEGDVLYLSVESMTVHQIRQKLEEAIPNTQTHPEYIPHITLGYLKPGAARKYLDNPWFLGQPHPPEMGVVGLEELEFSNQFDQRFPIFLKGGMIQFAEFDPSKHPRDDDGKFTGDSEKPLMSERIHYDPAKAVAKIGNSWWAETVKGDYFQTPFKTRKEAVQKAVEHLSHVGEFYDEDEIEAIAAKRAPKPKKAQGKGHRKFSSVIDSVNKKNEPEGGWVDNEGLVPDKYKNYTSQFAEDEDDAPDATTATHDRLINTAQSAITRLLRDTKSDIAKAVKKNDLTDWSFAAELERLILFLSTRVGRALVESRSAAGIVGMATVADTLLRSEGRPVDRSSPVIDPPLESPEPSTATVSVSPVTDYTHAGEPSSDFPALPPPIDTPTTPPPGIPSGPDGVFPDDGEPEIHFPELDSAVNRLRRADLFTSGDYLEVAREAQQGAFAVTGELREETLNDMRHVLARNLQEGADAEAFVRDVNELLDEGTGLSEARLHQVFRNNMQTTISDSMERTLAKPLVVDFFQYRAYFATTDERTRDTHRALEKLGLNGTNIYNKDDPVWQEFRSPWEWNCRCSWAPVTVRDAAARGVVEAQEWWARAEAMAAHEGGRPARYLSFTAPETFQFVPHPPFNAPPGFNRT